MGLIMGALAERYLFLSVDLHGSRWLTERPLVWVIGVITFVSVFLPPILRKYRAIRRARAEGLGAAE